MNKLLWDFKIQTEQLNRTSLTLSMWYWIRIERKCLIIDVAFAFDIRVKGKEKRRKLELPRTEARV